MTINKNLNLRNIFIVLRLKFYIRLCKNANTKKILYEWININPKSRFFNTISQYVGATPRLHLDGSELEFLDRCQLKIEINEQINLKNQREDPMAKELKKLLIMKNRDLMRDVIEDLIHAKNNANSLE